MAVELIQEPAADALARARFTEQESLEAANFTLLPTLVVIAGALLAFIPWVGWIFAILAAAAWLILAISSVAAADVADHFGWIGTFFGMEMSATSDLTRALLDWTPTGPTLIEDIASGAYSAVNGALVA